MLLSPPPSPSPSLEDAQRKINKFVAGREEFSEDERFQWEPFSRVEVSLGTRPESRAMGLRGAERDGACDDERR